MTDGRYENECRTEFDEQCSTVYEEKCETGYETVNEQVNNHHYITNNIRPHRPSYSSPALPVLRMITGNAVDHTSAHTGMITRICDSYECI